MSHTYVALQKSFIDEKFTADKCIHDIIIWMRNCCRELVTPPVEIVEIYLGRRALFKLEWKHLVVFGQKGWNCRRISTSVSQMLPPADERILQLFLEIKWVGDNRGDLLSQLGAGSLFSFNIFWGHNCLPLVSLVFMVKFKRQDSADYASSRANDLKEHLQIHSGEKSVWWSVRMMFWP